MDRATQSFLQNFSDRVREEGETLQSGGCVKEIYGSDIFVQGVVDDGGVTYKTTLRKNGEEWGGRCSSDVTGKTAAVYATMLERIERGGKLPDPPDDIPEEKTLQELMEDALDRDLKPFEEAFADKLEKRYTRLLTEGEIFDHDLVRLNPKWVVESYDALVLWNTPPEDIIDFWNYIAYAFDKKGLPIIPCMRPLTDLEETRGKIESWERAREINQWNSLVAAASASLDAPTLDPPRHLKFRLVVLPSQVLFQMREELPADAPEGTKPNPWAQIGGADKLADLNTAYENGALRLDGPSDLLWSRAFLRLREADGSGMRFDEPENCALFARLFEQPDLIDRIVTLDEQPVVRFSEPLQWICEEPENNGDDDNPDSRFLLRLANSDGEPIHFSLKLLPGQQDWYLADDALYPGPPRWTEGNEVEPRYEILEDVLVTNPGIAFLSHIGAELPPSIRKKAIDLPLSATFDIRVVRAMTGADSEHVVLEATAADPDGVQEERFTKEGWQITKPANPPEGKLLHIDRVPLRPVPRLLDNAGFTYDIQQEAFKARVTKAFPEKFSEWLKSLPENIELTLVPEIETLRKDPVRAKVRFEIAESDIDWFDLKIVLDVEGLDLSQKELRTLVAARGGYVRMDDGGWLRLEFDLDEGQQAAIDRLGLDIFDLDGETHRMHVLQLADPAAKEVFDAKMWGKIMDRSETLKLEVAPPVPDLLKADLRAYQVEGYHFLAYLATNSFGGILADDMGLGKTVQALTWLVWLRERNAEKQLPTLVVCPKSVLDVWSGECKKFAPHLRVKVIRTKDEFDVKEVKEDLDVVVLNYAQLRVNADKLHDVKWLAVILDEAQQIKNPDSKAAKSARELNSQSRLVLTGTPIENRLLDMWSLMAFAMPGVLGDRKYFKERFDRRKDPGAQTRLSARLRPFLLRRTKDQVAIDLPPRTEEEIYCKMEGVQAQMYTDELQRIQDILTGVETDESLKRNSLVVLQGLMRLRQICCHPGLIDAEHMEEESAKMNALFLLLDQLKSQGHKVLVFSQFVSMLNIIRSRLQEEDRPFNYLTGQTNDRQEQIEKFQTATDPNVFLLSLKAGGAGLNLTSASYVVLYDPWWNPAVEAQAIDRTHRIGQKNKVNAYRLLMRDSVEEKIRVLQQQKTSLVTGVLGQESFTKNLSKEDLAFLFQAAK